MPSLVDDLFTAFQENKNEEMINLITEHPELVNAIHPETEYSFMKIAIMNSRPLDLIKFIVSHPKFDFTFLNLQAENNFGKDENNLDVLVNHGRVDIIEFLLSDPRTLPKVIVNNQKLTYECARDQLDAARISLNREFKKNPDSKSTERAKAKIDRLEKMIPMLAEATVKEAVAKDSSALCTRLEKAGIDFEQPLSSGDRLIDLLDEQSNPRVLQWLGAYFAKKDATRPVIDPDCLNKERKLRAELDAVSQRFFAKQTEILEKAAAARLERMEKTANPSNPGSKM